MNAKNTRISFIVTRLSLLIEDSHNFDVLIRDSTHESGSIILLRNTEKI